MEKFNSDLSKVSDLPLPASEKTVSATVSCFDSNPEFLFCCSNKSVIVDSNLNTACESCGVGVVSTCNRYDVATYRSKAPFISDIEKKDLIKNVFSPDDNFSFPETNRSFKSEWLSDSLGYVILPVKMQFIVWLVFYLVTSFLKRH